MIKKIKVLTVFGTRPEAIKMAPVVMQLATSPIFSSKVCVTGQHRKMLDSVLDLFAITADYDLDIMGSVDGLVDVTVLVLKGLEPILKSWKPDWVLVHGDTSTSFAAALAAFYSHVKVAHVEAGLRTRNIYSPWPEEGNRHLTSVICQLHFAPTVSAQNNLLAENIPPNSISVTGNTVVDALLEIKKRLLKQTNVSIPKLFPFIPNSKKIILITSHRRENIGESMKNIFTAVKHIAERDDVHIVFPVHPNPKVHNCVHDHLKGISSVSLIPPLDYLMFIRLMSYATMIWTDSGGIQEEAPILGIPVLLLRDSTERPEGVNSGVVRLVGTDSDKIIANTAELLDNSHSYASMIQPKNLYGDGKAAKRIVASLKKFSE